MSDLKIADRTFPGHQPAKVLDGNADDVRRGDPAVGLFDHPVTQVRLDMPEHAVAITTCSVASYFLHRLDLRVF